MNRILRTKNRNSLRKLFLTVTVTLIYAFALQAQGGHTVTGTVSDASGTISGVNILVKGTSVGVVSDANGKYSIDAPNNSSVLVFSLLGYSDQEFTVGARTVIDVTMAESAEEMEELVVVGYGTMKKADLGGNVATINAKDLQTVSVANLSNALSGRLPGVDIRQSKGGKPGSVADVVVGARGTWNSTAPLYVIDGVVRDADAFNMLSSTDIESFSVLKDASAAAVYGARAANGVFLINTKKGKTGKPTITYSGAYTVGEPAYSPERETFEQRYRVAQTSGMEFWVKPPHNPIIRDDGYHPPYTSIYQNGVDASGGYIDRVFSDEAYAYYQTHQYDKLQEVMRTPITKDHSVNVSGGNDYVKYFIAGNYFDETGIFKSVGYNKYSIRSNVEAAITKNLKASLSVNIGTSLNKTPLKEDGESYDDQLAEIYYRLNRSSWTVPGMVDGQYIVTDPGNTGGNSESYTALANGAAGSFEQEKRTAEFTMDLTWDVPWVKGLQAKVLYNNYKKGVNNHAKPLQYEVYSLLRGNNPNTEYAKKGGVDPLGQIIVHELGSHTTRGTTRVWQENNEAKSYQLNGLITYANTFGRHAVEGLLVYEQTEDSNIWLKGQKQGLKVSSLPYLNFGGDDRNAWNLSGGAGEGGRLSYVGRFGYTYDNRYQASFSFRQDYSSKFGPSNDQRKGFFPAGNVYWRVSEESFMKNISWINNLKLRASIGLTGNDNVSAFQYLNTANIGAGGVYWGGSSMTGGVQFGSIANTAITWEKTLSRNIGVDFGLFNMFNVSANLWKKHTYDILGSRNNDLPDTFGGSIANINYGKVDAFGFDFELEFHKQINKDINVWARGNFSWSGNKLIEYAEAGLMDHLKKKVKNYDRWPTYKSDGIVWDIKPQKEGQNYVYKDYNDGKGARQMFDLWTSTGNHYVVPDNYYLMGGRTYGLINAGDEDSLRPGTVFCIDMDGDGHFDNDSNSDRRHWGVEHFNPPYNYGLLLGGDWKGLSLEVLLQGAAGHQNYVKYRNFASYEVFGQNYAFWSSDMYSLAYNPKGKLPYMSNPSAMANGQSDFWIRNSSYLRVKNVTLGYDLPKSLLSNLKISGLKVYVSAQNLFFVFNNLKWFDPELIAADGNLQNNPAVSGDVPNSGMMNYPIMRTLSCGITLSF